MVLLYFSCVVISIILYIILCVTDVKRSIVQNILFLVMIISNIGYLCLAISKNLYEAILAYKITYLGGCYIPVLYFFTVCEICRFNIRNIYKFMAYVIQTIVFGFACTIGLNGIFYKKVSYSVSNGCAILIREYGPTHFLVKLSMVILLAISVVALRVAIKRKQVLNIRDIRYIIVCGALGILFYFGTRLMGIKQEFIPISYIFMLAGILPPVSRINMYTVEENQSIISEQLSNVGFITFNKKFEFMSANEYAINIFDELADCKVGKKIVNPSKELGEIISFVDSSDLSIKGKHFHKKGDKIQINDKIYTTEVHTLNDFKNAYVGFTIVINDNTEHFKMLELTEQYNEELSKEVEIKTRRIRSIQEQTIIGIAQMVESRDLSTGGHIKRTSDVVRIFANKLLEVDSSWDKDFLDMVIRSAPMHDIGKIGVDDVVLRKQGRYNDEEYNIMKKHAEIGGKMVTDILSNVEEDEFVKIAYNVANCHHEKVNGKGYPEGLVGEEIPIEARIMALADVFDALVSKRCYKQAYSYDKAFKIIMHDAGIHFDKNLAEVFLTCRPELEEYYNKSG